MADIVLLQPVIGDYDKFKSHPEIPLGLLSAAVFIHQEYDVKIIDARVERNWQRLLHNELEKRPLLVGITCMIGKPIKRALAFSRFVKDHSDVPVVWGGPGPTTIPEETIRNQYIDTVVTGEGEYTLKELTDALRYKKSLHGIKGLWFKENGAIVRNEERAFCDLNTLPDLPYHLINIDNYKVLRRGVPSLSIETSRGCPHECKFCCNAHINQHKWRALTAENTIGKIEYVYKNFGVNGFYIVDDNF